MEGGVRPSRTSSRYASSGPSPPPFNGPVRKWKKQWVTTAAPPLLLRRWTPISAAAADLPSARRFRYAPVVPIERGNVKSLEKEKLSSSDVGGITTRSNHNIMIQDELLQEVSEDEEESNKREGNVYSFSEKKRKLSPGASSASVIGLEK